MLSSCCVVDNEAVEGQRRKIDTLGCVCWTWRVFWGADLQGVQIRNEIQKNLAGSMNIERTVVNAEWCAVMGGRG